MVCLRSRPARSLQACRGKGPQPRPLRQDGDGEAFITDEGRAEINARFAPLTVDMETAAMAHVCYVNRVPFAAIRSVTDTADHSGMGTFEENCARASAVSATLVLDVLRELTR